MSHPSSAIEGRSTSATPPDVTITNAGIVKIAPATSASPTGRRRAGDVLFEDAAAEAPECETKPSR